MEFIHALTRDDLTTRKIEHYYLKKFINENDSYVLSLGGGTPCYANNMEMILQVNDLHSIYLHDSRAR